LVLESRTCLRTTPSYFLGLLHISQSALRTPSALECSLHCCVDVDIDVWMCGAALLLLARSLCIPCPCSQRVLEFQNANHDRRTTNTSYLRGARPVISLSAGNAMGGNHVLFPGPLSLFSDGASSPRITSKQVTFRCTDPFLAQGIYPGAPPHTMFTLGERVRNHLR
jgi:hypothetical protein